MTIQVPLEQQRKDERRAGSFYGGAVLGGQSLACANFGSGLDYNVLACANYCSAPNYTFSKSSGGFSRLRSGIKSMKFRRGKSSAARVSRGSEVLDGTWNGITVDKPKRHRNEHITATIVMYYTCSGGVPSAQDVKSAIDDLEELYQSVETSGRLGDEAFDFMKSELTVKDAIDINKKWNTQPPPPAPKP